ncbi:DUF1638 domain-containing protein [Pontivivens insulae]|nr:DUF1638 domain-containing protein [Pontivivens insulae]
MIPDPAGPLGDAALRETGIEIGAGKVLLLACGALAREILAVNTANGADHFTLRCLPAILHNHPDRIVDALRPMIARGQAEGFAQIFILYGDCGTGGQLDALCQETGVDRIAGPHCYSFFEGNQTFAARGDDDMRAFYLTDFLVRQFDAFFWRPMALDRHPELRDSYFGHYETLVYMAQTEDAALSDKAVQIAERLALKFERRATGYGDLANTLARL